MSENFDPSIEIALEPSPVEETVDAAPQQSNKAARNIAERQADVVAIQGAMADIRLNTLTDKIEYGTRTHPITLQGDDIETLTVRLAMENKIYVPEGRVRAAVKWAAKTNKYCPIQRYLMECCATNDSFDGWDNLGQMLLGTDDRLATIGMQKFLVGAVARAFRPGCAMQWIPIFIGRQGCGKSQLLRSLVPNELFAEVATPLDTIQKEPYRLHIAWLIELPEVDYYFKPQWEQMFKNLITVQYDETRKPYESLLSKLQRRFVLAGTSNRSELFVDPSGSRRFLPIEIPEGFETPWRDVPKIRDALWAKAVREHDKGFEWNLNSGDIAAISDYMQQFNVVDPWEQLISVYLDDKEETTTTNVLLHALSFTEQAMGRSETRRASAIMTQKGWRRMSTTRDGKKVRLWRRPKNMEAPKTKLTDF